MRCPYCQHPIDPVDRCPHCGQSLIHQDQWLHLYTVPTEWEAELLKGLLQSHQIPVIILSQRDSSRQLTVGHLALVRIYVPLSFAATAFQLLMEYEHRRSKENGE